MTIVLATIVDTDALLKSVVGGLGSALFVTLTFSIAIFGAVRVSELRRDGRGLVAAASAMVFGLALAAWAAAIVFGLIVMTQK